MDSSNSEVSFYEASKSSSHNNSIHIDEYNERSIDIITGEDFQMNRESKFRLIPNPMEYDINNDEWQDEEFPKSRDSQFSLSPNPKDFERNSDEC